MNPPIPVVPLLLLVDDDRDILLTLRLQLEADGYRVMAAEHVQRARGLLLQQRDRARVRGRSDGRNGRDRSRARRAPRRRRGWAAVQRGAQQHGLHVLRWRRLELGRKQSGRAAQAARRPRGTRAGPWARGRRVRRRAARPRNC